jgi:hypothetical protein
MFSRKETPMMKPVRLPLYLTWSALKKLIGWPYGRSHTKRLESEPAYHHGDPFPQRGRIGAHQNAHPLWYTPDVLDYLKRHGLPTPDPIEFS